MSVKYLSRAELEDSLPEILESPRDAGVLAMIVQRPGVGERLTVQAGTLSLDEGLVGDNWKSRGRAHPDRQVTIMNARAAALVAQDSNSWPLAGDQLYIDLDLSLENLPAGSQLKVGDALVEITAVPHRGCKKFLERFGRDAMEFVNSDAGCRLNIRGVNAKVIKSGEIKVNDIVTVGRRGAA